MIIYSYDIKPNALNVISLAARSEILRAGIGGNSKVLRIWVEVPEVGLAQEDHYILVIGTGIEFSSIVPKEFGEYLHIYKSMVFDGPYVWHVYELYDWK